MEIVYSILKFDELRVFIFIIFAIISITALFSFIREKISHGIILTVISIIILGTAFLIPTTKQATAIYLIPKIVENEDVKQIPANLVKLINESLKLLIGKIQDKENAEEEEGEYNGAI